MKSSGKVIQDGRDDEHLSTHHNIGVFFVEDELVAGEGSDARSRVVSPTILLCPFKVVSPTFPLCSVDSFIIER